MCGSVVNKNNYDGYAMCGFSYISCTPFETFELGYLIVLKHT